MIGCDNRFFVIIERLISQISVWPSLLDAITPKEHNALDVYTNNSLVTIDIINEDGSFVEYTKSVTHISLIDGLTTFIDCLSVAGRITKLKIRGAIVIRKWKEYGFLFWKIKYPKSIDKGEFLTLVTTANLLKSFTKSNEYWETSSNNHNMDSFKVVVKFLISRPPQNWYLQERVGTKYFNKGKTGISTSVSNDRMQLILEVNNPINHTSYILRWDW